MRREIGEQRAVGLGRGRRRTAVRRPSSLTLPTSRTAVDAAAAGALVEAGGTGAHQRLDAFGLRPGVARAGPAVASSAGAGPVEAEPGEVVLLVQDAEVPGPPRLRPVAGGGAPTGRGEPESDGGDAAVRTATARSGRTGREGTSLCRRIARSELNPARTLLAGHAQALRPTAGSASRRRLRAGSADRGTAGDGYAGVRSLAASGVAAAAADRLVHRRGARPAWR